MQWSGIISLFIASLEFILLVNILIFAERNTVNRTASYMVFLLMTYQFLEYLMCGTGAGSPAMAYAGFSVISFLPPAGLLLILRYGLASGVIKKAYFPGYTAAVLFIPALFFVVYYGMAVDRFEIVSCTVLYASYNYPLGTLFGFFYYLPILITMYFLVRIIKSSASSIVKLNSKVLLTAYIITSVPVITAFILSASGSYALLSVIESIMCKFALVLAMALSFVSINNKTVQNE